MIFTIASRLLQLLKSLSVSHLLARTDILEASVAKSVHERIAIFEKNRGKDKRPIKALVFVAGLSYYLSSIVFRLTVAAALVSLFYILRLVIPIVYFWFAIAFGWSLGTSVFAWTHYDLATLGGGAPGQILSMLPSVLITAIILTIYVAIIIVITSKYCEVVFSQESPTS